jgi:hypothetical protein
MESPQSSTTTCYSVSTSEKQPTSQASDAAETTTSLIRSPLQDEILMIRQLFGYFDTSSYGTSNLRATLPNSSMKDVLLTGIDVDTFQGYEHLSFDPQLHIGLSILETRALYHLSHEGLDLIRETNILKSYQFVVEDPTYGKTAPRKFMFGKP